MAETEMMAPKTVATETTVPFSVGELDSKRDRDDGAEDGGDRDDGAVQRGRVGLEEHRPDKRDDRV